MRNNKGFTLIELMVVILIVAILAAVLAPMLTGRIREAKWTEGRAGAGTIATALRAWAAETGVDQAAAPAFTDIGIENADLAGKYFAVGGLRAQQCQLHCGHGRHHLYDHGDAACLLSAGMPRLSTRPARGVTGASDQALWTHPVGASLSVAPTGLPLRR